MSDTNYHYHKVESRPALIEVEGGITIRIDENNNINIDGHNDMNFNCNGDLNINAKKINMVGKDDILVESKTHMVHKAPRIDLNPDDPSSSFQDLEEFLEKIKESHNHDHET
jgi:hypothetical protein